MASINDILEQISLKLVTEKQIEYGKLLGIDVTPEWTHNEFTRALNTCEAPLSMMEKINIITTYGLEELSEILHRPITDIHSLTRKDLNSINVVNNKTKNNLRVKGRPIAYYGDIEYGLQKSDQCPNNELYYLRTSNIFMSDLDSKTPESISMIYKVADKYNLTIKLYETTKGFHIFVVSKYIDHRSEEMKVLMKEFKCDPWYTAYAYSAGYKVRLSPKIRDSGVVDIVGTYHSVYGLKPVLKGISNYLELHDELINTHSQK